MQIKHLIVLLITLALFTQPVSAGFFEDFVDTFENVYDVITGRTTEEVEGEITEEPVPEPEPVSEPELVEEPVDVTEPEPVQGEVTEEVEAEEPIPEESVVEEPVREVPIPQVPGEGCFDSDGGRSIMEKGYVIDYSQGEEVIWDRCTTSPIEEAGATGMNYVAEHYCKDGKARAFVSQCSIGCKDGACIKEESPILPPEPRPEPEPIPPSGECKEGKTANYVCEEGVRVPWCECSNNMWVCKISPENACPPPTEPPKTCAAKIKISSDKVVYYVGEYVTIVVDIFDSEGNRIPNYHFYGQLYDDRWHTPDLQRTNEKGYFRVTNRVEDNIAVDIGKVKFKIYTKEIEGCGEVQDIIEIKLKRKEPEPCGIGKCVPEPECEDKVRMCGAPCVPCPEEEEEEKIFYPCTGCELDDKCYPFGYRKAGEYCSDNYQFMAQLEDDASCENNFECKTNLCIDGQCLSSNIWKKVLSWIKRFVGKPEIPEPPKPPKPEPKPEVDCSELLIEKDIGEYKYTKSGYGDTKESQAPLYSKEGEQIGIIKCCMAGYIHKDNDEEKVAIVCPYDNRKDFETSLKWILIKEGDVSLVGYKDERVYGDINEVIIWTNNAYIVASGGDPRIGTPVAEDIADAYLDKYPNDLG